MIYAYFDKYGRLVEIINNGFARQGTETTEILVFSEQDAIDEFTNITATYEIAGYKTGEIFAEGKTTRQVPYSDTRNYKYFKDFTPYNFWLFEIPTEVLLKNGLCRVSFRWQDNFNLWNTLGLLAFNIEDSVIEDDNLIPFSEYNYLLSVIGKYETFYNTSVVGNTQVINDGDGVGDNVVLKEGRIVVNVNGGRLKVFIVQSGKYKEIFDANGLVDFVNQLDEKVDNNRTDINLNRSDLDNLKPRVSANENNIAMLETDVVDLQAKDTLHDTDIQNNTTEITNIKNDYAKKVDVYDKANIDTKLSNKADLVDGVIPIDQIPGLVNDIINGNLTDETHFTDILGKVWGADTPDIELKQFFDITTKKRYLWSGVQFVEITDGAAFGTVKGTAYEGNEGQANRDSIVALQEQVGTLETSVDSKLPKATEQEIVYGTDNQARQTTLHYNVEPYGDGIAKRTQQGTLKGNTATEDNDLVNLSQLNELLDKHAEYVDFEIINEITQENAKAILDNASLYEHKTIYFTLNGIAKAKGVVLNGKLYTLENGIAKEWTTTSNKKLFGNDEIVKIADGTDLFTYDFNSYENGTWFKGKDLINVPSEIVEHTEVMIQLVKYQNDRFELFLHWTGIYEAYEGVWTINHYADKFFKWKRLDNQVSKEDLTKKADLDSSGKILNSQLPPEFNKDNIRGTINASETEFTDTNGKVWKSGVADIEEKTFIENTKNVIYVWSGSKFVSASSSLGLGETSGTAYEGSKGKANATAIANLQTSKQDKIEINNGETTTEFLNSLKENGVNYGINAYSYFDVNKINFDLDIVKYESEENNTWEQWVNSTYNTGKYKIVGNDIQSEDGSLKVENQTKDLVIENNGVYKLINAGDELLGTWVFNNTITLNKEATYNVSFINVSFGESTKMKIVNDYLDVYSLFWDGMIVYNTSDGYWSKNAFKTIEITDTSSLTNRQEFTTWLKANATKQGA